MENTLQTVTVKQFMQDKNFTSVVKVVRVNTNSYPYVTFISADNVAENIYFSKNAAQMVAEGSEIARGFFDPFMVGTTTNAEGEIRMKLVAQGDSNRASIEDLF